MLDCFLYLQKSLKARSTDILCEHDKLKTTTFNNCLLSKESLQGVRCARDACIFLYSYEMNSFLGEKRI